MPILTDNGYFLGEFVKLQFLPSISFEIFFGRRNRYSGLSNYCQKAFSLESERLPTSLRDDAL